MTITNILFSLVFILGIAYLVLFRFKQYRMDKFRQNVFALRDELFDYAAEGNIGFNHPAYITLRSLLNGYIRFSHRISLLSVILLILGENFLTKNQVKPFDEVWSEATSGLGGKVKKDLELFVDKASANLFYYVFISSLLKKLVAVPFVLVFVLTYLVKKRTKVKDEILIHRNKDNRVEIFTYKYSKKQVAESIEQLNTDALVFGSIKPTSKSRFAVPV